MLTDFDYGEINRLKDTIRNTAFSEDLSRLMLFDNRRSNPFWKTKLLDTGNAEPSDTQRAALGQRVNDFVWTVAMMVYDFKTHADKTPEAVESEIRQDALEIVKKSLESGEYSEKAIASVLSNRELNRDIDKKIAKFKRTADFHYFAPVGRQGRYWVDRENEVICKIKDAYTDLVNKEDDLYGLQNYAVLSDRKIISSMAIIFDAVGFWPAQPKEKRRQIVQRYIGILKKRFRQIKADSNTPKTMDLDPDPTDFC